MKRRRAKVYVRRDDYYTLPCNGNLRVLQGEVRPILEEIEVYINDRIGVVPTRSQIVEIALLAYRDYLKRVLK